MGLEGCQRDIGREFWALYGVNRLFRLKRRAGREGLGGRKVSLGSLEEIQEFLGSY